MGRGGGKEGEGGGGAACTRSTRRRGDAMHACTNADAAGMLTGTFLDDVATNEIFALDTAGPPSPSSPPRN